MAKIGWKDYTFAMYFYCVCLTSRSASIFILLLFKQQNGGNGGGASLKLVSIQTVQAPISHEMAKTKLMFMI